MRECSTGLDGVLVTWRNRLQTLKRAANPATSRDVAQELFADLNVVRNRYTKLTLEKLRLLIVSKFEQIAVPQELLPFLEVRDAGQIHRSPLSQAAKTPFDPMMLVTASFGGNAAMKAGSLLMGTGWAAVAGTGGMAIIPIAFGVVGGGAWLLINRHFRQGAAARNQLMQELQRVLAAEKGAVADQIDEIFRNLKPELITLYREQLRERMLLVQQSIEGVKNERRALDEKTLRTRMESYRQQLGSVENAIAAFSTNSSGREPFTAGGALT